MINEQPPFRPQKASSRAALGRTYNRLTVLQFVGKTARRQEWLVECQCSCGIKKVLKLQYVTKGNTKSCGCLLREVLALPTQQRKSTQTRKHKPRSAEAKKKSRAIWIKTGKDKIVATARRFRERHPEQIKAEKAAYFQKTKHLRNEKMKVKFATDLAFRIEATLRSRMRKVLKRQNAERSGKIAALLGCSLTDFKDYFQSLFTEGMSWEAFMRGEIHVDHKKPCALFDFTDPVQQLECFHFSNLQPLWEVDNLRKGKRYPSPLVPA